MDTKCFPDFYKDDEKEDWISFRADRPTGWLRSRLNKADNSYEIVDYYTYASHRNKGHGKELLRATEGHARALGARALIAPDIVTRESLDALVAVFGSENIEIDDQGDYADDGKDWNHGNFTRAALYFALSDTSTER